MIEQFIERQCETWPLLRDNRAILANAPVKNLGEGFSSRLVQYRKTSATANVEKALSGERPCFLCRHARPAEQQILPWRGYEVLANPYPLHLAHLTIADKRHTPQVFAGRLDDMMALAEELPRHVIFYNGPRCGASAPDHFHFQAVGRELALDFERCCFRDGGVTADGHFLLLDNPTKELFRRMTELLPAGDPEPMMNILALKMREGVRVAVVPRKAHRPKLFGEFLISPASIEMTGFFNLVRTEDFERFDCDTAREIINDVCLTEEDIAVLADKL